MEQTTQKRAILRSAGELRGYKLLAKDGEIGIVNEFLFDDTAWTARYLFADTGGWLLGRRVLIAPKALGTPDWEKGVLPVDLTKEQIEKSPGIATDQPVSRQYHWSIHPMAYDEEIDRKKGDPHLRSTEEVIGYDIQADDGGIGHVDDFLFDDRDWRIRYLVVDTRDWLPGRKVLVAAGWITKIDWPKKNVFVDLSKKEVRNSPDYDSPREIDREYEESYFEHYRRRGYWV